MAAREARRQPLYRAIARDIWRTITERHLSPGESLPTETDLAEHYEVSRLTLRQALDELRRAGAIDVVHGRGAFVAQRPTLVEFATQVRAERDEEYWRSANAGPSLRKVTEDLLPDRAGPSLVLAEGAGQLGLEPGQVQAVHTVMLDSGTPWIANTYVFAGEAGDRVLAAFERTGLMRLAFADHWHTPLVHHWRAFSAAACSMDDADALGLEVGSPMLVREGVMGTGEEPLVYVARRMHGESARFVLHYLAPDGDE